MEEFITELKPEHSGKKVSCEIERKVIKEGQILFYKNRYHILNDVEDGGNLSADLKTPYKYDWCVGDATSAEILRNQVQKLKFFPTPSEIINKYTLY